MIQTAYRLTKEGKLEGCEAADALAQAKDRQAVYWIHLSDYTADELTAWLPQLKLSPLMCDRVLSNEQSTQVIFTPSATLIRVRALTEKEIDAHYADAICQGNLLVTTGKSRDPAKALDASVLEDEPDGGNTVGELLCLLLLSFAGTLADRVLEVRRSVFALDEQIETSPETVELEQLMAEKGQLLQAVAIAEEQSHCFAQLARVESASLDLSKARVSLRALNEIGSATSRMADRLQGRLASVRSQYEARQQEKVTHRLAILTVLSAVFLPLTLAAGIWGMNFEAMPELKLPYGYPLALGAMGCIAGLMLLFFRNKGWFD